MSPEVTVLIGTAIMLTLLVLGVPIAFAMLLASGFGLIVLMGFDPTVAYLKVLLYEVTANFTWAVIPLFILMGNFALHSDIATDGFRAAAAWIGHLPGGLAAAAVAACALFAATSGSAMATAVTIGRMSIPQMLERGYDPRLATGTNAAAGTLGMLIPPSINMVIICFITGQSLGKLMIAGILPGVFTAAVFMGGIFIAATINPQLAPPCPRVSLLDRFKTLRSLWSFALLIAFVMGSIYTGLCTPVEAAAIGVLGAFVIGVARRKLTRRKMVDSIQDSAVMSSAVLIIVLFAHVFAKWLTFSRLPFALSEWLIALQIGPWLIFAGMCIVYIILGMFLDAVSMMLITLPIFYPAAIRLGFDPTWFGIMIIILVEVANITPPTAACVWVIKSISPPEVTLGDVFQGVGGFVAMELLIIVILSLFPQIVLVLPNMMFGR